MDPNTFRSRELAAEHSKTSHGKTKHGQREAAIRHCDVGPGQGLPLLKPCLCPKVAVHTVFHPIQVVEPDVIISGGASECSHRDIDNHVRCPAAAIPGGTDVI